MTENFNHSLRRESMALSQRPDLHELVQDELANICVIPERDSPEAMAIDEIQKPLRYALLAKAIEDIVSSPSTVDLASYKDPYDRSGFELMSAIMQRDYIQRVRKLFEDGGNQVTDDLINLYNLRSALRSQVWEDPQMALAAGVGTFNSLMPILMSNFNSVLEVLAFSSSAKKATLDRSYSPLIDIAGYDTLQLMAVLDSFDEKRFPRVSHDAKGNRMILTSSPKDIEISDKTKEHLSRYGSIDKSIRKVAEIDAGSEIIGCPVLFRPGQVKKIWQEGVDIAYQLGVL